jgi:hypothetical protein
MDFVREERAQDVFGKDGGCLRPITIREVDTQHKLKGRLEGDRERVAGATAARRIVTSRRW